MLVPVFVGKLGGDTFKLVGKAGDTVRLPDGRSAVLAKDGRNDVPTGTARPGADGLVRLALDGPATVACDAVELTLGETGGPVDNKMAQLQAVSSCGVPPGPQFAQVYG